MTGARLGKILLGGLKFDISAILYSNSLFILLLILPIPFRFTHWYKQILKWVFLIINAIALAETGQLPTAADTRDKVVDLARQWDNKIKQTADPVGLINTPAPTL